MPGQGIAGEEHFVTLLLSVAGACVLIVGVIGPVLKEMLLSRFRQPSDLEKSQRYVFSRIEEAIREHALDHAQQNYKRLKTVEEKMVALVEGSAKVLERQDRIIRSCETQREQHSTIAQTLALMWGKMNGGRPPGVGDA